MPVQSSLILEVNIEDCNGTSKGIRYPTQYQLIHYDFNN